MAGFAQVLVLGRESISGTAISDAMFDAARRLKMEAVKTSKYIDRDGWLMLWGVGAAGKSEARNLHVSQGRPCILWDMGYFGRAKRGGFLRVSLNEDHPWRYLDLTYPCHSRFDSFGIELTQESKPDGHIVIAGLGCKSRDQYPEDRDWEARKLEELRERFPGRRIVFRPKPNHPAPRIDCEWDTRPDVRDVIRGASLVVTRHSGMSVDACIMGIPFECDDGAAYWLKGKPYTRATRKDFLNRLAWWQWKPHEALEAFQFVRTIRRENRQRLQAL